MSTMRSFSLNTTYRETRHEALVVQIKNVDDDDSIQFNSILYYLCAESIAVRPITDTAECTYK
jgi:hypothetical protein